MVPVPSTFTPGVIDWTSSNSSPMNLSIIYFADAWKLADNILEPALPTTNDDNKNKNQPPPAPATTTKTNNTLSEIKILHPSCIHFFNLSKARGPPRAALRPREDGANRPLNGRERVQGPPFKGAFSKTDFPAFPFGEIWIRSLERNISHFKNMSLFQKHISLFKDIPS